MLTRELIEKYNILVDEYRSAYNLIITNVEFRQMIPDMYDEKCTELARNKFLPFDVAIDDVHASLGPDNESTGTLPNVNVDETF